MKYIKQTCRMSVMRFVNTRYKMVLFVIVYVSLIASINGLAVTKTLEGTSHSARNINGGPALQGEFPSQLSLRTYNIHSCGASIINSEWALTAAHCLTGSTIMGTTLFSGSVDLKGNGTVHPISNFIVHPDYVVFHEQENDIALVKVTVPFELDGFLRVPIELPDQDDGIWEFVTGMVVGWGVQEEQGTLSDVLRKVKVQLSNQTECRIQLRKLHHDLYPTHICADAQVDDGTGRSGPCYGDYGGPLIIYGRVLGIASWGDACNPLGNPYTVYTKVSPFINWIFNITGGPPAKSEGLSLQLGLLSSIYVFLVFPFHFLLK